MNRAACARRLASPVRLTLATELGNGLDGGWWPHTASVARELPDLIGALSSRLGEIFDISVNWSSLEGHPDLDAVKRASTANPVLVTSHQRLMMITGSRCSAKSLPMASKRHLPSGRRRSSPNADCRSHAAYRVAVTTMCRANDDPVNHGRWAERGDEVPQVL